MFERLIKRQIQSRFFEGRIIVLYGARQVGKTTLVRQILDEFDGERTYLNCDEPDIRQDLTEASSTEREIKREPGEGRLPESFTEAYPEAQTRWVRPESLLDFIRVEPDGSDS